jgi:hypothetical protein
MCTSKYNLKNLRKIVPSLIFLNAKNQVRQGTTYSFCFGPVDGNKERKQADKEILGSTSFI